MTEFMNLREGSWLLFALSFISRSLGELNAWLNLRRAQWRVSTSPSPCAFGCMCVPVCVQWGKAPLPPDPKGTHSTKNLSDAHSTWQFSRLELDAHMCPHADHLSTFRTIKKKKEVVFLFLPSLSISGLWAATLLKSDGDLFHFKGLFYSLLHKGQGWIAGQHIRDGLLRESAQWTVTERVTVKWHIKIY